MVVINSFDEFAAFTGKELGASEFLQISQEMINRFADATLDHQWIHTDPERAKSETAFGTTIAHGYLTISVIPHLWSQIAEVRNIKMLINYGISELRFGQPVLSGDEVRLRVSLISINNLRGIAKAELEVVMEIKGKSKPAFSGKLQFLYHFI
ncbi:MAG: MaoC family dehydratase [Bacteroidetes bacterium]|nr:MaoC family dehydratase [Bacteroidota bacterium]